jgi:crossover junction endodeoxyribonuclease RuvC
VGRTREGRAKPPAEPSRLGSQVLFAGSAGTPRPTSTVHEDPAFPGDELLDFPQPLCNPAPVGITLQQFEQLKSRAGGMRRVPTAVLDASLQRTAGPHEIILGIDPSLRGTGFGVIRRARPHPVTLAQGTVHCPAGWARSRCLVKIAEAIRDAVRQHRPTVCVVEGLFFAQNLQTALILGEARGAALVAAAEAGLEVYEIAPRKVKQAIVGYGGAQKLAVAKMVQRMLDLAEPPAPDAADALALALAHAHETGPYRLSSPRRI